MNLRLMPHLVESQCVNPLDTYLGLVGPESLERGDLIVLQLSDQVLQAQASDPGHLLLLKCTLIFYFFLGANTFNPSSNKVFNP